MKEIKAVQKAQRFLGERIVGNDQTIELLFAALIAEGHVLLESVPGSGKTQLAKLFAQLMNGRFSRVQFTPDVLPSDVTGVRVYNPKTMEFELHPGPAVTNILLADEINRASPKTQSSLLEVMEERQTTVDGQTIPIAPPFIVIATQNPVETGQGTFPLPEAQLDRFLFKIDMGYPSEEEEKRILMEYQQGRPSEQVPPMLSLEEILHLRKEAGKVQLEADTLTYLLDLVRMTREKKEIERGASTRASIALMKASQARALLKGRSYVLPDDITFLAPSVLEHRIVLSMEGALRRTKVEILQDVLREVPVPVEAGYHS
ncbi:MoxR family ATPase [Halobacillus kuroshimensis]|uniref:MoxR family ATPase n=1 Tax=Halobacillus kuroshimensis TaxID=302481 RepID=A0ABS3DVU5_9BACI|nr:MULTISPECIES: MoxR family ATPase [Halobacillus]MBN8235471.1 MoxR family ATPase [Halobacillus kuroshimensis]